MSDAAPAALEQAIRQFVIYERPADYPDGYVVREWQITSGKAEPGQAWTPQRWRRLGHCCPRE